MSALNFLGVVPHLGVREGEVWDGSTLFGTTPSNHADGFTNNLCGPGTVYPCKMTVVECVALYWQAKTWQVKTTPPVNMTFPPACPPVDRACGVPYYSGDGTTGGFSQVYTDPLQLVTRRPVDGTAFLGAEQVHFYFLTQASVNYVPGSDDAGTGVFVGGASSEQQFKIAFFGAGIVSTVEDGTVFLWPSITIFAEMTQEVFVTGSTIVFFGDYTGQFWPETLTTTRKTGRAGTVALKFSANGVLKTFSVPVFAIRIEFPFVPSYAINGMPGGAGYTGVVDFNASVEAVENWDYSD